MHPPTIVAVVGAGTLGGALAHTLASHDRLDEIRLIDSAGSLAAGKALDIQQAGGVEGFRTRITSHTEVTAAAGASVIVVTGPPNAGDDEIEAENGLRLIESLANLNRQAVLVCAGPAHRPLIERAVIEACIPRRRLIGSAPYAFESSLRAIVAVELRCAVSQVALTVLGTPPEQTVVPWSQATVRGFAIPQVLNPTRLARLRDKVGRVWPPGPYALASAATRVCEAVIDGADRRGLCCFITLDGEWGVRRKVVAFQVELDAHGVSRVLEPVLSVQEKVRLETALQKV